MSGTAARLPQLLGAAPGLNGEALEHEEEAAAIDEEAERSGDADECEENAAGDAARLDQPPVRQHTECPQPHLLTQSAGDGSLGEGVHNDVLASCTTRMAEQGATNGQRQTQLDAMTANDDAAALALGHRVLDRGGLVARCISTAICVTRAPLWSDKYAKSCDAGRHLEGVDDDVGGEEDGAQRPRGQAARLVVDLRPEQHQQRVGAEEEQPRQVQQHRLQRRRLQRLHLRAADGCTVSAAVCQGAWTGEWLAEQQCCQGAPPAREPKPHAAIHRSSCPTIR